MKLTNAPTCTKPTAAALAKWSRNEPKVLLLDEPTQRVDVGAKASIYELVASAAQQGAGVTRRRRGCCATCFLYAWTCWRRARSAQAEALEWCQRALVPEQADRAQEPWESLCSLVDRLRPAGGSVKLAQPPARVRPGRVAFRMPRRGAGLGATGAPHRPRA